LKGKRLASLDHDQRQKRDQVVRSNIETSLLSEDPQKEFERFKNIVLIDEEEMYDSRDKHPG
jgi:hypothetical protein